MGRDFEKNPYSKDEMRIAQYFWDMGIGGGDDPIGSLIASHGYIRHELHELKRTLNDMRKIKNGKS